MDHGACQRRLQPIENDLLSKDLDEGSVFGPNHLRWRTMQDAYSQCVRSVQAMLVFVRFLSAGVGWRLASVLSPAAFVSTPPAGLVHETLNRKSRIQRY